MPAERQGADLRWLALADEDLRVAKLALGADEPALRSALFHCQQAAEKALKAVLAGAGQVPPRTHDLVFLADMAAPVRPGVAAVREDAGNLMDYAVEPRYPFEEVSYTPEEAALALARAESIVRVVKEGK